MYIYQLATDQDKLAMRPANAALRLAMLLAEADKQGEDVLSADLKEIVVKKGDASIKVWETLFGAHTKLERQGEDYLITYSDEAQLPDGFFMAGSVLVKTNGTKVLNQSSYSAPWTVEMQDLKVVRLHEYRSAVGVQFRWRGDYALFRRRRFLYNRSLVVRYPSR